MVRKELAIAYFAHPDSVHDCKWINYFAKRYKVIVFCPEKKKGQPFVWLDKAIKAFPILPVFPALNFTKRNKIKKQIQQIIKEEKITVLHSMYAVPNAIWADLAAVDNHIITTRGSDILVDYSQTYQHPESVKQRVSYSLMRRFIENALENAKVVTSTSFRQRQSIEKIVGPQDKLKVIRTGVDVAKFNLTDEPVATSDKLTIFSPRSMKPIYNIELLLKGANHFRNVHKNITLKIINDDPSNPYAKSILDLIDQEGFNDFVEVLPRMTQETMRQQYLASDIVVMIPKSDGTPVSAIEAMLLKKPLLLGALEYDKDLFNNNTSWKITDFSKEAISEQLTNIWTNPELTKLKTEQALQEALEKASLDKSLETMERLYMEVGKISPTMASNIALNE